MSLPTGFPTALSVGDVIQLERENVRSRLAYIIMGLLGVLTIGLVIGAWAQGTIQVSQLLITGIFTPIIGIAGTVLGFYFGAESQKK